MRKCGFRFGMVKLQPESLLNTTSHEMSFRFGMVKLQRFSIRTSSGM